MSRVDLVKTDGAYLDMWEGVYRHIIDYLSGEASLSKDNAKSVQIESRFAGFFVCRTALIAENNYAYMWDGDKFNWKRVIEKLGYSVSVIRDSIININGEIVKDRDMVIASPVHNVTKAFGYTFIVTKTEDAENILSIKTIKHAVIAINDKMFIK